MSSRESFIFYNDWLEPIERAENPLLLYRAIVRFALCGEEPDSLAPYDSGVFLCIRMQVERTKAKYDDIVEKRREAGRKHKGNQYTRKMEQVSQNGTNGTDNVNDNDNDNDNVNDNESYINEDNKENIKKKGDAIKKLLGWVKSSDSQDWFERTIRDSRTDETIQTLAETFVDQVDVKTNILSGARAESLKHFQRWIPIQLNKIREGNETARNQKPVGNRSKATIQQTELCSTD